MREAEGAEVMREAEGAEVRKGKETVLIGLKGSADMRSMSARRGYMTSARRGA